MIAFITTISIILAIIVLSVSFVAFIQRKNISSMTGMMAAMGTGMTVGLTIGILLGVFFQGDLLTSTIISMLVGLLAGIVVGLPFHMLAVLDGLLAGLMGGMMGAMLGIMISIDDALLLSKILLSISICISILFIQLFTEKKGGSDRVTLKWLIRPFATFLFLFLIFITLDKINVSPNQNEANHSQHQEHNSEKKPTTMETLEIVTTGFNYTPSKVQVKYDTPVQLKLVNKDRIEHDIEIVNIPHKKEAEDATHRENGHHHGNESIPSIHIHAKANSTAELTFTVLSAGVYEFYCTIPGHKEAGMTGTLEVH